MIYYLKKLWLLILKLFKKTNIDNQIFQHFINNNFKKKMLKKSWDEIEKYVELKFKKYFFYNLIKSYYDKIVVDETNKELFITKLCNEIIRLYNTHL